MKTLLSILETIEIPEKYENLFKEDCICIESGHLVYWPNEVKGYLDEHHLILLAAYLHKKNKPWDEEIERSLCG